MTCTLIPTFFEEAFDEVPTLFRTFLSENKAPIKGHNFGVTLYEDDQAFVLEAAVPGVKPDEIKIFFDKGGVSIEAKGQEEKKEVKYHLKSSSSFSYWVPLPAGRIDEGSAPEALCKDGILKVTFPKSRASKPLKIAVRQG